MHLYFRFFYMLIAAIFKKKVIDPYAETTLRFRVLPTDLDLNGHMNNGRYLTVMDIGRMDFVMRIGLAGYVLRNGYIPVLASASIRYRLPLLPFQSYDLKTRIVCWDKKWVYMEQRFILRGGKKAGAVAAVSIIKGNFFSKKNRATIPTGYLLKALGRDFESPPMPNYISQWAESEETLRQLLKTE